MVKNFQKKLLKRSKLVDISYWVAPCIGWQKFIFYDLDNSYSAPSGLGGAINPIPGIEIPGYGNISPSGNDKGA